MTIYTASKAIYGPMWRVLREKGWPINSTWIDESGEGQTGDWADLWSRCVTEAATADALLVYARSGDVLKGALVEVGAALAAGKPVHVVDPESTLAAHSWTRHPLVTVHSRMSNAARSLGVDFDGEA